MNFILLVLTYGHSTVRGEDAMSFITLAPADFLSGQYTVFGRVIAGQDVLQQLTRTDEARVAFGRAASLSGNAREREVLLARAAACVPA